MTNFNQPNFIPRYRTIKDCLVEIKALDPQTAVTEFFIRQLCKQDKVKYMASGNKSLVLLDDLLKYLGFGQSPSSKEQHNDKYGLQNTNARRYPNGRNSRYSGYFM